MTKYHYNTHSYWNNSISGIMPYQEIKRMIEEGQIRCATAVDSSQIQPASLDLRLGRLAYQMRASFLPGLSSAVMDKIDQLDGDLVLDLLNGALLERGCVYIIEILETLNLPHDVEALANTKSSIGRLDILTRLITDGCTAFDRIDKGYKGRLFLEIVSLSFNVVVSYRSSLNQLRFQRGESKISSKEMRKRHALGHFAKVADGDILISPRGTLLPCSIDLQGSGKGTIVGYKAKKNTCKIDIERKYTYPVSEFWEQLYWDHGQLILEKDEFYILGTREELAVPPDLAAEMLPFNNQSGEFRVHYAGFFDPGFGWVNGQAQGSRAVLEVRSYGAPFVLEHGQIVGWLHYLRIASGQTDIIYGAAVNSNYQGQKIALARHFVIDT
ncbi:deoxycytidine triphosphate deaminase [Candidatus Endolissoclinum faulkneri L2]|uniref:Deoxycytidine triphosphate deaminase n=1 Tax=Candidatus Endolissoclinum faulkneri L2 TaxID=1193729 RepID=K7Z2Q7_9PROT|nr:2'-deoxycytidine 5'-triphosphate deaminase [Candidatus Endolissoclinum faulkneri]AFX98258.1 deoxycytidine triphosphate deaminase [Candidatus Endolissoclinum faulkneri L2]